MRDNQFGLSRKGVNVFYPVRGGGASVTMTGPAGASRANRSSLRCGRRKDNVRSIPSISPSQDFCSACARCATRSSSISAKRVSILGLMLSIGRTTKIPKPRICWFGNQFSLVAPRIQAHAVEVWVPELGGRFDPHNVTHSIMMSMLGGLSESERQHVQQRTRASMDAQVLNEGRHQGGRAPYGYLVVDGPPHPNPNRASDGSRLRILSLDVATAPVVQRIFRDYIAGRGDKAIAHELNREGIPCPSAHRPEQNRHRSQDGWQASTVSAILQNPRYTGYAIFGRWNKQEELLDPDDVAAGHITRLRRSPNHRIIRSKKPAHPAIVTVETFTQAQLIRRQRASTGNGVRGRLERTRKPSPREYLLRGLLRCELIDSLGDIPGG
ncbi:recombinase family protein [Nocardia amikacinitolerans]|uniref:recombinase family protein n=1 Tax=Nocardia amikacinitolerans TaxID=756689 RepID=UPI0020A5E311|nr:recombinase family protein [Nocardia amikacinitolerans]